MCSSVDFWLSLVFAPAAPVRCAESRPKPELIERSLDVYNKLSRSDTGLASEVFETHSMFQCSKASAHCVIAVSHEVSAEIHGNGASTVMCRTCEAAKQFRFRKCAGLRKASKNAAATAASSSRRH